MKLDKNTILPQLNLCYIKFDKNWDWGTTPGEDAVTSFIEHIREDAGIDMAVEYARVTELDQYGWRISKVDLVDEQKFTLWMLRWS